MSRRVEEAAHGWGSRVQYLGSSVYRLGLKVWGSLLTSSGLIAQDLDQLLTKHNPVRCEPSAAWPSQMKSLLLPKGGVEKWVLMTISLQNVFIFLPQTTPPYSTSNLVTTFWTRLPQPRPSVGPVGNSCDPPKIKSAQSSMPLKTSSPKNPNPEDTDICCRKEKCSQYARHLRPCVFRRAWVHRLLSGLMDLRVLEGFRWSMVWGLRTQQIGLGRRLLGPLFSLLPYAC